MQLDWVFFIVEIIAELPFTPLIVQSSSLSLLGDLILGNNDRDTNSFISPSKPLGIS